MYPRDFEGVSAEIALYCSVHAHRMASRRSEAQTQGPMVVVSEDFNAVVGTFLSDGPPHRIGDHAFGERNDRGQQFVD